jgi:hypothetical protein
MSLYFPIHRQFIVIHRQIVKLFFEKKSRRRLKPPTSMSVNILSFNEIEKKEKNS